MYELKTNTAVRIPVGPLVDPTDGKTAKTSLTVTDLSVQLYQIKTDGSAVVRVQFAPTASGGNNDMALVSSSTDGMYDLELTAAQLNWLGSGRICFYDIDGFLVHWIDISIVSAAYFDWKYGSTIPDVNATKIGGTTQTARDIGANVDVAVSSRSVAGAKMDLVDAPNATAVTAIQSGLATAVWNYLTTALTVTGSVGKLLTDNIDAPISEAGGGSGLDAAGVRAAVGLSTANLDTQLSTINSNVDAILVDTSTTIPALINADSGAGAISWTYTLTDSDDGTPIDGAEVWVTTDAAGEDVVASGSTNSFGVVTFMLDAGAYYFWRKCSGYNFNNPDLETVS